MANSEPGRGPHPRVADRLTAIAQDAVAELRALLREAADGSAETLTEQLADLVRRTRDSADRSATDTLLALLDAAVAVTGSRAARFTAELERGLYLLRAGLPGDSLPRLAAALELADAPEERCRAVFHSGVARMELGNAAEAEAGFRKALDLATEADDIEGLVQAANRLAALAVWRNTPRDADGIVSAARLQAERANRPDLVLYLVMVSAVRFASCGEFDRAEEEYVRLAELASAPGPGGDADERHQALAASLAGRITLRLRREEPAEAARLAPRLRALLDRLNVGEQVRDLVTLSQVGLLLGNLDDALEDAFRAVGLSGGERLRPEQAEALSQLSSVYLMRGAYEPAHRTCLAALRLIEDSRTSVGDAQSRVAFVEDRSALYQQAVRLCLILAKTLRDPAYRAEALTWVERIKSRTLGELLGLGSLAAPAGIPADMWESEQALLRRIRRHESAGGLSRDEYHEAWRRLETLWEAMEDEAPEYVALRRGLTAGPDQIRELLGGADRLPAPRTAGTGASVRSRCAAERPEAPPRMHEAAREVDLELPEGGHRRVSILAGTHTDSRRRLLDRITRPAPVGDRLIDLVRNLAAVDTAWWPLYGDALDGGRVPQAEQLGEWLRRCVAQWGSDDQRQAAERWWNDRLVSLLCRTLTPVPPDDASWAAVGSVLRKDRTAADACRALHDRGLLPGEPAVDERLAREKDMLAGYFFDGLAHSVRAASRSGPPGAALARFRLGLRAAVLLVPGDARLLAAGTAFVDEFPEYRYV
ncbi:hypothetical protein ACIA98_17105 [Streptomyces sp. NPDC051366]|uniref:hypothetical protein n=1 Tax=Streptomyces sp. NPDC051366 TaxID=3365652 RepID=UPI0037A45EE1